MEDNQHLNRVILSVILNEANIEQTLYLKKWLEEKDENKLFFNQVLQGVRLMQAEKVYKEIDTETEWAQLKNKMPMNFSEQSGIKEARQEIQAGNKLPSKKGIFYRFLLPVSIAASIILLVGLGWRYLVQDNYSSIKSLADNKKDTSMISLQRIEYSNAETPRTIRDIRDGSVVTLEPNTEISFFEPFKENKRDFFLSGKANFKVAKDSLRPFTVFSGDIQTTALGTDFDVTAYKNTGKIIVRLYHGRVVVKSRPGVKIKLDKDYYLVPGQELVYNTADATTTMQKFIVALRKNEPKESNTKENVDISMIDKGSWYMFNNQSLSNVFDQLSVMFDTEIEYNRKDIEKLYFIGRFSKTDSLPNIIKQIVAVNNLKAKLTNNRYVISKK